MMQPDKRRRDEQDLSLREIIDVSEWQKIHDKFSEITDVFLRTFDSRSKLVLHSSKKPRLCGILSKDFTLAAKICAGCLPTFLGGRGVVDRNLSFQCEPGLHNFVIPLRIEQRVLGYIVVGPVILVARKPKERYRHCAQECEVDLDEFWSALSEIKVISFRGAQSLVELIKDVSEYSLRLSYQNLAKKKQITVADTVTVGKLMDALLDVAFQVTGADVGSIMLLNADKDELGIRASRGLSEDVVRNSRVRLGDGISGRAAAAGEPLLVDDNTRDNRIKQHLNRPQISSAMVVPIKVQNKVWGVMNLGALRSSDISFKQENVQLVNRLVDLATVALQE